MDVFVLYGSAKKQGTSSTIADTLLASLPKGSRIQKCRAAAFPVAPCRNCGGCAGGRPCVIQDDMTPILGGIQRADVLVLAAPIYYYGMPAPLKACFDRLHAWPPSQEHKPKSLLLLTVSADTNPRTPQPLISQMELICEYRGWKLYPLWIGGAADSRDLTDAHRQQIQTFTENFISSL